MPVKQRSLSQARSHSSHSHSYDVGFDAAELVTRVDAAKERRAQADETAAKAAPLPTARPDGLRLPNETAGAQNSESRIVAALRGVGYQVDHIAFHIDEKHVDSDKPPRVLVAYVDRPLAGSRMDQIERRAILETLKACGGNQAQASRLLGISEKTIYNKLRHYRRRNSET